MKKNCSLSKGFTLIELLVIIGLIGILATAVVVLLNPGAQLQKSRDSQRKNDLAQLQRVIEQYYNDVGSYPLYTTTAAPTNYNIKDKAGVPYAWGAAWYSQTGTSQTGTYTNLLPKDPLSTQRYVYISPCGGADSYCIYTHLEIGGKDPQACNVSGTDCTNAPSSNQCGNGSALSCNFGVSSPNTSP